ncbi:YHS domain-containing protein, partial [Kineococcus endophyticus]
MTVDPATTTSADHDGHTYYFCSPGCRTAFSQDPDRYIAATHDHTGHDHTGHENTGHDHTGHENTGHDHTG